MDMKIMCKSMFLFEQHILLHFGYVFMAQEDSDLDATRCNFTSNYATYGGAIFARVSTTNQLPDKVIEWIGAD